MIVGDTFIEGLKLIRLNRFEDQRGSFMKVFHSEVFAEKNLATSFKESYFSVSNKNAIRGMHFQVPPFEHVKLVYLNQGAATDVVLDLRSKSATFGKYFTIELTEENPVLVYIPVGCAHGFLSKKDHTMITYLQTSVYNRECDRGIRYDSFGFEWEGTNFIVSERDRSFDTFQEFKTIF